MMDTPNRGPRLPTTSIINFQPRRSSQPAATRVSRCAPTDAFRLISQATSHVHYCCLHYSLIHEEKRGGIDAQELSCTGDL